MGNKQNDFYHPYVWRYWYTWKKMKAHMECVRLWVYVYQIKLHIEQTLTTFTNNTGKIV